MLNYNKYSNRKKAELEKQLLAHKKNILTLEEKIDKIKFDPFDKRRKKLEAKILEENNTIDTINSRLSAYKALKLTANIKQIVLFALLLFMALGLSITSAVFNREKANSSEQSNNNTISASDPDISNKETDILVELSDEDDESMVRIEIDDFSSKKVFAVCNDLEKLGFSSIVLVPVPAYDIDKYDMVASFSIDGESYTDNASKYSTDSNVILEYYDKYYYRYKSARFKDIYYYKWEGKYPRKSDYAEYYYALFDEGNGLLARHVHEVRHADRYTVKEFKYEVLEDNRIVIHNGSIDEEFEVSETSLTDIYSDGSYGKTYSRMSVSGGMAAVRGIISHCK